MHGKTMTLSVKWFFKYQNIDTFLKRKERQMKVMVRAYDHFQTQSNKPVLLMKRKNLCNSRMSWNVAEGTLDESTLSRVGVYCVM